LPRDINALRKGEFDSGLPIRGISDLVALALAVLELSIVRRSTVRLLCPDGERVSKAFGRALRTFEQAGYIQRENEYLRVLNRGGLLSWIQEARDLTPQRARSLLNVQAAVSRLNAETINADPAKSALTPSTAEIRRQELIALSRLMEAGPGSSSTGKGAVRIVPRSRSL
jgi:hypothetical protein